jgi:hypothetical protein
LAITVQSVFGFLKWGAHVLKMQRAQSAAQPVFGGESLHRATPSRSEIAERAVFRGRMESVILTGICVCMCHLQIEFDPESDDRPLLAPEHSGKRTSYRCIPRSLLRAAHRLRFFIRTRYIMVEAVLYL